MKMYILIRESIPSGHAVNSAAHASLACYLKYKDREDMHEWITHSFKKVICMVSDLEFDLAKSVSDNIILTESHLGGVETSMAFCPRQKYPPSFKYFRLWK